MLKFCVDYVTANEAKRFEVNLIVTFNYKSRQE